MKLWHSTILGIGLAMATAPALRADFFYSFTNVDTMTINSSRTINVFLNYQPGTGPNNLQSPGLQEGDTGLRYSAIGATISVTVPSGVTNNLDFNDFAAVDPPNDPDFTPKPGLTNLAALRLAAFAPFATTGSVNNTGGSPTSLYIGSFTLNAGPLPGVVTLDGDRRNLGGLIQNIVDGNGVNLDPMVSSGSTMFLVVIPEPTSMILVGLAATGFVGYVRRKRRAAVQVASDSASLSV